MVDIVRTYLCEIGRLPLLTHEQEIVYGKQVQQMMSLLAAKEALTKKLCREPTLSEWAAHVKVSATELNENLLRGQQAKQHMLEGNLRLVVSVAKKYQKRQMDFLDLIQEGTMGLERGVEKFDPTRGYKFSTYAYWWILQAITRAIAEKSRIIRLPIHITEKLNQIKKAQRQFQKLGRVPTASELAVQLEMTPKQVLLYLERAHLPLSLNLRVGDNQDTELGELLEDTSATPEEYVMQSCLSTELERLMSNLTSQQRQVLVLRFGLENEQALTLAKVGNRLQLSPERVRQIERTALRTLRQQARNQSYEESDRS